MSSSRHFVASNRFVSQVLNLNESLKNAESLKGEDLARFVWPAIALFVSCQLCQYLCAYSPDDMLLSLSRRRGCEEGV